MDLVLFKHDQISAGEEAVVIIGVSGVKTEVITSIPHTWPDGLNAVGGDISLCVRHSFI